jgi:tetratricopeptide (TPR) repeat protein
MPKQPLNGIAHSILTSHRIVRTRDEPFPWDFFIANYPLVNDLLYLDSPPGKQEHLAPLVIFRAFRELAGTDNRYLAEYRKSLDEVAHTNPDDSEVLSGLGWLALGSASAENAAKAIDLLSRAVERGSTRSSDYDALASLLAKNGRWPDAVTTLEKGIQLFPYEKQLANRLTLLYISRQQYVQAIAVMRRNVTLFPEDDTMRKMLDMAQQAGSSVDGYRH